MIRLCLADDQTLVRLGLRRLLDLAADMAVVAEASNGHEAVEVVQQTRPDVLLLDVRMPGLEGPEVLAALNLVGMLPATLMLTNFHDDEVLLRSRRSGARGYLLKDVSLEVLLQSIRQVAQGQVLALPEVDATVREGIRKFQGVQGTEIGKPELTRRELEILRLLAQGYSNREMAEFVSLSEGSVKNLVSSILLKLQVRDRTRAVLRAVEIGLL